MALQDKFDKNAIFQMRNYMIHHYVLCCVDYNFWGAVQIVKYFFVGRESP